MRISVIVPVFNAATSIEGVLRAIDQQDIQEPYEIICVDDGSSDDTAAIIKKFPHVIYCYQTNAGPAAARNAGARLARGEFLAFTDSDCFPQHDWLSQLMKSFSSLNVAVVCGSYGIANASSRLARGVHREILYRHQHLMPDYPKAFGGYNFCVKKNIFWQAGGFNESYRRASGEDNDLSYKILEQGGVIFFNRQARVDHLHPVDVWRYLKEQYRHGFWRVLMYKEHPKMMRGDDYTYWKDIVEMPLALGVCAGIVVTLLNGLSFEQTFGLLIAPFLIFELVFAKLMIVNWFDGIFFGFVIFFRAFARLFGFSTGILNIFLKTFEKKVK